MPNWCENNLEIVGKKEAVKKFKKFARGYNPTWPPQEPMEKTPKKNLYYTELCFDNFVSVPAEVLQAGYSSAGYDWCVKNWGTKWDIFVAKNQIVLVDIGNGLSKLVYCFDTAWSPPVEVIEKMAKTFINLNFVLLYGEPGCSFSGEISYVDGSLMHDLEGDYGEYFGIKEEDAE